jgi:hypothetical protein
MAPPGAGELVRALGRDEKVAPERRRNFLLGLFQVSQTTGSGVA